MDKKHQQELASAKERLTQVSLAARVSNMLGTPIEGAIERLPQPVRAQVSKVTAKALEKALGAALFTLSGVNTPPSNRTHKLAAAASGALGGAFGIAALSVELPISTTIMLRSIADIARSEGEELESPATKLACIEVLALGGSAPSDDAAESGYFAMRTALAMAVSEAATHIANNRTTRFRIDRHAHERIDNSKAVRTRFDAQPGVFLNVGLVWRELRDKRFACLPSAGSNHSC